MVTETLIVNHSAAIGTSEEELRSASTTRIVKKSVHLMVGITSDQTCLVLKNRLRILRMAGFKITLVSSPGRHLLETATAEGVAAKSLPMLRGIAPLADLVSFLRLLWLMLWRRPQITDFSTPKAALLGNVAAWILRVPHRVYTLRGLKLEATRGWKLKLLLAAERVSCATAHVVLCNSESLSQKAVILGLAPPGKLRLLGNGSSNGVDTERFSPGLSDVRRRLCIPDDEPVLGFVGRLTRDKGLVELLQAFDLILSHEPKAWLLLVGWFDGSDDALDEKWRLRTAVHARIRHVGFVEDTTPYYRAMDLLILPTYREGFPNVVLEAAASGIPTIATDCTGARDSVIDEVTGLLIPPGNAAAIAEAALELLQNDPKRKRMGKAARQWALDFYDQRKVLGLAVDFYRSLLEK